MDIAVNVTREWISSDVRCRRVRTNDGDYRIGGSTDGDDGRSTTVLERAREFFELGFGMVSTVL